MGPAAEELVHAYAAMRLPAPGVSVAAVLRLPGAEPPAARASQPAAGAAAVQVAPFAFVRPRGEMCEEAEGMARLGLLSALKHLPVRTPACIIGAACVVAVAATLFVVA